MKENFKDHEMSWIEDAVSDTARRPARADDALSQTIFNLSRKIEILHRDLDEAKWTADSKDLKLESLAFQNRELLKSKDFIESKFEETCKRLDEFREEKNSLDAILEKERAKFAQEKMDLEKRFILEKNQIQNELQAQIDTLRTEVLALKLGNDDLQQRFKIQYSEQKKQLVTLSGTAQDLEKKLTEERKHKDSLYVSIIQQIESRLSQEEKRNLLLSATRRKPSRNEAQEDALDVIREWMLQISE